MPPCLKPKPPPDPSRRHQNSAIAPVTSAARSSELTRRQPRHPPEILCETALARKPGRMCNLRDCEFLIAKEFHYMLHSPLHDKSVRWLSDGGLECLPKVMGAQSCYARELHQPELVG